MRAKFIEWDTSEEFVTIWTMHVDGYPNIEFKLKEAFDEGSYSVFSVLEKDEKIAKIEVPPNGCPDDGILEKLDEGIFGPYRDYVASHCVIELIGRRKIRKGQNL